MSSPTNITEFNPQAIEDNSDKECRRKSSSSTISFSRLFSRDSIVSNLPRYSYELYPASDYRYSLCGKEFLLKMAEILISVICVGMFADGIQHNLGYSPTSMLLPNVVYSSCMINTSVIALGYLLGQVMPEVLIRIFDSVAFVLFVVTTCINASTTYKAYFGVLEEELDQETSRLLLAQVFVSFGNVVLYGVDLVLGIRRSLKEEW